MVQTGDRSKRVERTDVEFPLWRKKVDNSIFRHGGTTVPNWAAKMWDLDHFFPGMRGKKDESSRTILRFEKSQFEGWVTCTKPTGRKTRVYRLWFEESLHLRLEHAFLMSYMRDLEGRLQKGKGDLESEIPFWEFLDIEFDAAAKEFHLAAHYKHPPLFPELFKRLTTSPVLKRIDDEVAGKNEFRIHKQDWKPRSDFEFEVSAKNVIYTLIDTRSYAIYIGETEDLIKRFRQGHSCIAHWDFYRYDRLPAEAAPFRVSLERMLIRSFASVLPNRRDIAFKDIGNFRLANERIDF